MAATLSATFAPSPLASGEKIAVYASPQVSQGINFLPRSAYRLILVTGAAPTSPINLLSAYTARFGALAVGRKIFLRLQVVTATGFAGPPVESSLILAT